MATLLVVDDSEMERRLVGRLLEKHTSAQVCYADSGESALEQLRKARPDLVLTDLHMPNMDGLELLRSIRSESPSTAVVLMTAQGSEEIAVEALQAGAASYIPKRLVSADLVETVEHVLAACVQKASHERLVGHFQSTSHALELPNDRDLITALINHVQNDLLNLTLNAGGMGDDVARMHMCVALDEALMNAFYHGNLELSSKLREDDHQAYENLALQRCQEAPYRERRIFVELQMSADQIQFVVRDEGPGFDVSALPDPTAPENLELPHGRGALLMRTFMDEVEYNDLGNQVKLIKRFPRDTAL